MVSAGRDNSLLDNKKCVLICFVVSLANCQYGFDTAAVGGFQAMIGFLKIFGYPDPELEGGWGLHTKPQQLIASFINVGVIVGTLVSGPLAGLCGRKPALWIAALISMISCAVMIACKNLAGLYAGRVLLGVGNGLYIVFCNIYTVEAAPARHRAILGCFFIFWVTLGTVFGALADNYTATLSGRLSYQIPLAVLFVIPVLLSIFIIFVPESPRWLLLHNRVSEARSALRQLRGSSLTPELLNEEFVEMQRGIEEENELASTVSPLEMFKGTNLRRTTLAVAAIASHAACGIFFTITYGTYYFQRAGISKPFEATVIQNALGWVGGVFGMYLMHKVFGRRTMVLIGTGSCALCMLTMGLLSLTGQSKAGGQALVSFSVLFNFFYAGFIGGLTWPIASEIASSRLRVYTVGLATSANYFFNWLISYCTPFFLNTTDLNWGAKYAYIWAGSNAVAFLFFLFFLPETKGRTLEEIDELFVNEVPRRQFKSYHCVSSDRAQEMARREDRIKENMAVETIEKV